MSKRHSNHNRPITIGDLGPNNDPWLDEEIAKIRAERIKRREKRRKRKPRKP